MPITREQILSQIDKLPLVEAAELFEQLQNQERQERENRLASVFPEEGKYSRKHYPAQMEFFRKGRDYPERAAVASNRSGKSFMVSTEATYHLTGLYPEWWEGKVFDKPIWFWAIGISGEATRDALQATLLGSTRGSLGEGLIPKHCIDDTTSRAGIPGAVLDVYIRHKKGWVNRLTFKSCDQDPLSFAGASIDGAIFDEEPKQKIYSEVVTRTATTKGIILAAFTPLNGLSDVATSFLPGGLFPENGIVNKFRWVTGLSTWDQHIPHLEDSEKERLKSQYAPHEMEARTKGIPQIGSGKVYPIAEDDIVIDNFAIPSTWPKGYGFDVGWQTSATVFCALNPGTGTIYVYDEVYRHHAEPPTVAHAIISRGGDWMTGAIDYAGGVIEGGKHKGTVEQYTDLGLTVIAADKAVETGILVVWKAFCSGKLKIMRSCQNLIKELRLYCRNLEGQIIKKNDHAPDALRYFMMTGIYYIEVEPDEDKGTSTIPSYYSDRDETGL